MDRVHVPAMAGPKPTAQPGFHPIPLQFDAGIVLIMQKFNFTKVAGVLESSVQKKNQNPR